MICFHFLGALQIPCNEYILLSGEKHIFKKGLVKKEVCELRKSVSWEDICPEVLSSSAQQRYLSRTPVLGTPTLGMPTLGRQRQRQAIP